MSLSRGTKFLLKFWRGWSVQDIAKHYKANAGNVSVNISSNLLRPSKRCGELFSGKHYMELTINDLRKEFTDLEWCNYLHYRDQEESVQEQYILRQVIIDGRSEVVGYKKQTQWNIKNN